MHTRKRQGLTLLELVVVMMILVALAGILVPMLPGMMGRAHTSTGATNMDEINKLFLTHYAMEQGYPNGLDNLVDDSGTLFDKLPGASIFTSTAISSIDAEAAEALVRAGISEVYNLVNSDSGSLPDDWSPTFNPYADSTSEAVEDSLSVAVVDRDAVVEALDAEAGSSVYVVFGLGKASPVTGANGLMLEAPVHFGEDGESTPDKVYSRFGVVFQVVDADGDVLSAAKYAGAVAFHDDGIVGADAPLEAFHAGHEH